MSSQGTSWRSCRTALPIIGPRQTTGVPFGSRNPMETSWTPCFSTGRSPSLFPRLVAGRKAEHGGQIRPRDVGVHEAHLRPAGGEGDGEVGGDRRFADASLVRGHGDDVAHAVDRLLAFARVTRTYLGTPVERDRLDAGEGLERRADILLDDVLEGAGGRRELDLEADGATFDGQLLDHPEGDDVAMELRIVDRRQSREDSVSVNSGGDAHWVGRILRVRQSRRCEPAAGTMLAKKELRRERERETLGLERDTRKIVT